MSHHKTNRPPSSAGDAVASTSSGEAMLRPGDTRRPRSTMTDIVVMVFTGLIFITYVTSDYFLWRQLGEAEHATKVAERAWVTLPATGLRVLEPGKPLYVETQLVNTGKSVTTDGTYIGKIVVAQQVTDFSYDRTETRNLTTAFPQAIIILPFATKEALSAEQVNEVLDGRLLVYVFGEISYKDIFGDGHVTQFCAIFVPATKRFENYCKGYPNYAN